MTAEEVLKEMEADWERFLQTDSMKRLIIDPDSRRIIGPKGGILLGVENDKEVERKYFECPKIVGNGIDISDREYQLRINYRNARGDEDTYLVDDVEVSGNNITFSWELWRKVTLYKGEVKFILCVVRPDGDLIDSEWNTTLATGIVLEGLEVENPEPTPEEKDVVAQLINMMQTESSKAVEAVKAEGELQVENVKKAGAIETEKAAGAVRELTDATDSAERKRAELENVIEEANAAKENGVKVKESLDESIEGAVGVKESLDSAREEAETGHDRLNQKIVDAEAENGEIAESIRLAGVAKENLNIAISDAGIAYRNIENKIEESNTAGNELIERTKEADSVKSSLEKNISSAGLAEDSLRKGINAAQTTTEDLLEKKEEAVKAIEDTAKEEKEGIAAAVTQYIEENQLEDGESAYEIAVQSGFVGTKEEWLESLKGETGPQGPKGETGEAGPQGPQGETGYTPQKGIDYSDGKNGSDGISPHIGDNGNWFVGDVDTGVKAAGKDGEKGEQGEKGADGSSVNPDWEQNDRTQLDYIQNRTHYIDRRNDIEFIAKSSYNFTLAEDRAEVLHCHFPNAPFPNDIVNMMYEVLINDSTFSAYIKRDVNGKCYLGNNYDFTEDGSFHITEGELTGSIDVYLHPDWFKHDITSFGIKYIENSIHRLSDAFIPINIVRESDLAELANALLLTLDQMGTTIGELGLAIEQVPTTVYQAVVEKGYAGTLEDWLESFSESPVIVDLNIDEINQDSYTCTSSMSATQIYNSISSGNNVFLVINSLGIICQANVFSAVDNVVKTNFMYQNSLFDITIDDSNKSTIYVHTIPKRVDDLLTVGGEGDIIRCVDGVWRSESINDIIPKKGIDYFTDADKQEIVTAVINSLPKYNGEVIE